MSEISPFIICPVGFCTLVCLLIGGVLFGISFSVGDHGDSLDAEAKMIQNSRVRECSLDAELSRAPVCEQINGNCLRSKPCGGRRLGDNTSRALGSTCCVSYEQLIYCKCPIDLKIRSSGASQHLAREAMVITAKDTNLNRSQTNWCQDELGHPPYERVAVTSSAGALWECGPEFQIHEISTLCAPEIIPSKQLECLEGADDKIRVGSKVQLEQLVKAKAGDTENLETVYRTVGIVLLAIPCTPLVGFLLAVCCAQVYKGMTYGEGMFSCLGKSKPTSSLWGQGPASIGAVAEGDRAPSGNGQCFECGGAGKRGLLGPVGLGMWTYHCEVCHGSGCLHVQPQA